MASRRQTLRCKVSVCPPEGEAQLDEKPKTEYPIDPLQRTRFTRSTAKKVEEASRSQTLHCKDSVCPPEGEAQLDEKPKTEHPIDALQRTRFTRSTYKKVEEASRSQTLHCKDSVCPPEGEAQLDEKPKTEDPIDPLQRTRFTRSTSKKVEEASRSQTLHCKDSVCPPEGEAQLDEKPTTEASRSQTLHCKDSVCPPEGEAQLDEKPTTEPSRSQTLHCKDSVCPPEGEAQLDEQPKTERPIDALQRTRFTRSTYKKVEEPSRSQTLHCKDSVCPPEGEAQLDEKPKTEHPIVPLQRTRFTRSTSKKVEETPSQPSVCSNGAPTMPSVVEIRETCRRQLRRRLVDIPLCENSKMSAEKSPASSPGVSATQKSPQNDLWKMSTAPCEKLSQNDGFEGGNSEPKENEELPQMRRTEIPGTESEKAWEAEKATLKKPQLVRRTQKSPQKRDRFGHWLPRVNSGKLDTKVEGKLDTKVKGKMDTKAKGKQDADVKCNANEENSLVQKIEAPGIEPERTKELQKPTRRKSLRVASQQSMLEKSCSTINIEPICLEHNGSKTEEHLDTNCGPDVAEQSELQTSGLNRRGKEELEVAKAKQDNMEMDKEEDKIIGQLPCDAASCVVLEQGSLPLEDTCRSSTQSASDSAQEEEPPVVVPKLNFANKEVQTVAWNPIVVTAEELKVEDSETEEQLLVEDPSPKESQKDVVKETPPFEPAHSNLRDGTKSGAVQSEVDMEGVSADPLTVAEERTSEMTGKQEMNKAEIPEADEKVEGVNDQAEAIATKVDQEAEEQNVEKTEETPKSALQLIVSNLDPSKNFGELQIAVISFFMERKLSVTSISMKKSRKRGQVTFLSGKDVSRALKYNGEQLLGRALRLRRPLQIQKPVAIVKGRKRKFKESDLEATTPPPAKKKNVQKTAVLTKKKKELVSLLKKKKKKTQEQTEKTEKEEEAVPLQKKKKKRQEMAASNEKSEEEEKEFITPSLQQQQKRKQEKLVLSEKSKEDEWKDKLPGVKKKIAEKPTLSEKREGETAPPLQKKKKMKKNQEKATSNEKSEEEEKEFITPSLQQQQKRKQEKLVLSEKSKEDEWKDKLPGVKKKIAEKPTLSEKREGETAPPLQKKKRKKNQEKAASNEKSEEEEKEFITSSLQQQQKRKQEKLVLSEKSKEDEWKDKLPGVKKKIAEKSTLSEKREGETAPPLQKKKRKKNQEKEVVLSEKRVEEGEKVASVLKKKKKKSKEKIVLSTKRAEKDTARPKKKKKKQEISSWCLCIQKVKSQEALSELKTAIANFLNGRSVAYKEIVLYPDSCSACVELSCEDDVNEALQFDPCKIIGEAARLSKVEKLGAMVDRNDPRTLPMKSLPSEVCAKDLKNLFERVAGIWIQECQQIHKRFAFVAFETAEAAANALSKGELECQGKLIQLSRACQKSKGKRKILMVKNLPYPLSKKYLKSIFNNAEDVRVSKDNQLQRIAYIEYKTAKQAKVALKEFKGKSLPGEAIRVASIEERKESPESRSDGHGPTSSLFIWGLSTKTTAETLKSTFKEAVNARLPQNAAKRFAYVDFKTAEEAARTRVEMQDVEIDGHKVKLYFANSTQRGGKGCEKSRCDLVTDGGPESSSTKTHEKRQKAKNKRNV
ncbi:uncharacterized protein LOC144671845 [Cetorhinus maximus]